MNPLPSITILMPSFNQASFIQKSIESVLSQNYPNLELIVIDGGSGDGTLTILKSFGNKISVISEKDAGQADALAKGLKIAKCEIIGWLNSDDLYVSNALEKVGNFFLSHPETKWLFGHSNIIDENGDEIRGWISWYKAFRLKHYSYKSLLTENYISQMGVFIKKAALLEVGGIHAEYHYAMDYDLWLRLAKRYAPGFIDSKLASFRMYATTKSVTNFVKQFKEDYKISKKHAGGLKWPVFLHFLNNIKIVAIYQGMAISRKLYRKNV